jgi:hypothetical protein
MAIQIWTDKEKSGRIMATHTWEDIKKAKLTSEELKRIGDEALIEYNRIKKETKLTLPDGISLLEWCRQQPEKSDLIYWKSMWNQVLFVRDTLPEVFSEGYEEYETFSQGNKIRVVGTHRSKSVELPVYGIEHKRLGFRAVMRNNFHDWNVSVDFDKPPKINPKGLYKPGDHSYCFWQGFPGEWAFKVEEETPSRFAFYCGAGFNEIYTFFWQIAHNQ